MDVFIVISEMDSTDKENRASAKCFKNKKQAEQYFKKLINSHNYIYVEIFKSELE